MVRGVDSIAFALETAGGEVHDFMVFRPFPLAAHTVEPRLLEELPRRESPQAWLGEAKPELLTLGRHKS